jgi:hypothetical protein
MNPKFKLFCQKLINKKNKEGINRYLPVWPYILYVSTPQKKYITHCEISGCMKTCAFIKNSKKRQITNEIEKIFKRLTNKIKSRYEKISTVTLQIGTL